MNTGVAGRGIAHRRGHDVVLSRKPNLRANPVTIAPGALELEYDEIEKMKDQRLIDLDTQMAPQATVEELLGIEPYWDREQVKAHLRAEFQKWNNRLNALEAGRERDNAQRMLDAIADARKRYD